MFAINDEVKGQVPLAAVVIKDGKNENVSNDDLIKEIVGLVS